MTKTITSFDNPTREDIDKISFCEDGDLIKDLSNKKQYRILIKEEGNKKSFSKEEII